MSSHVHGPTSLLIRGAVAGAAFPLVLATAGLRTGGRGGCLHFSTTGITRIIPLLVSGVTRSPVAGVGGGSDGGGGGEPTEVLQVVRVVEEPPERELEEPVELVVVLVVREVVQPEVVRRLLLARVEVARVGGVGDLGDVRGDRPADVDRLGGS